MLASLDLQHIYKILKHEWKLLIYGEKRRTTYERFIGWFYYHIIDNLINHTTLLLLITIPLMGIGITMYYKDKGNNTKTEHSQLLKILVKLSKVFARTPIENSSKTSNCTIPTVATLSSSENDKMCSLKSTERCKQNTNINDISLTEEYRLKSNTEIWDGIPSQLSVKSSSLYVTISRNFDAEDASNDCSKEKKFSSDTNNKISHESEMKSLEMDSDRCSIYHSSPLIAKERSYCNDKNSSNLVDHYDIQLREMNLSPISKSSLD